MGPEARRAFDHALACERRGDQPEALASYLDALELAPDDVTIAYRAATALLREGFLEEASSQLRRIVFIDPDHIGARTNLGNCQLLQNDLENAVSNFQTVLSVSPENRNALFGLASVYIKQGNLDAATAPAEQLLALLPNSAPALTLQAQALARDPQASPAAASFRKALSIDPDYTPALIGYAELLIRRKQYEEALRHAERAALLTPRNADPHRLIGAVYQAEGDLEKAEKALEKAFALAKSDQSSILVSLSTLRRKSGNAVAALDAALAAWRFSPGAKEAGNALGASLKALERNSDARTVLTMTAQNAPLPENLLDRIETYIKEQKERPLAPPNGTLETEPVV